MERTVLDNLEEMEGFKDKLREQKMEYINRCDKYGERDLLSKEVLKDYRSNLDEYKSRIKNIQKIIERKYGKTFPVFCNSKYIPPDVGSFFYGGEFGYDSMYNEFRNEVEKLKD
jgi:hypothetical protein